MISIHALVIGFVFVILVQDSFEAGQLAPLHGLHATRSDLKAADRTNNKRLAICKSLCSSKEQDASQFKKRVLRSSQLCIRECIHSKEAAMKNSRLRRNSEIKQVEDDDCNQPTKYLDFNAVEATPLDVDYLERKPNLSIKWRAVRTDSKYNWSSYAIFYHAGRQGSRCALLPKDKLEFILRDGDGWNYPDSLYLVVYTYPHAKSDTFDLTKYDPPPQTLPTFPPTSNDTTKVAVAVTGAVFGLIVLVVFVLFAYRRRINPCGFLRRGDSYEQRDLMGMPRIINNDLRIAGNNMPATGRNRAASLNRPSGPDTFYTCYFPENEWFLHQVASVVNFFRENGYSVEMDLMNSSELVSGPTRWAEQQIKRARNVLVFLSPGLLCLCGSDSEETEAHQEHERVWYELALLRKIYLQTHSARKMVCIALPNTNINQQELPLWAELIYKWPEDEQKIFKRLNDRPIIQPW